MRGFRDRVELLAAAVVWSAPVALAPAAAALVAAFVLPPGWWTVVGVVILWCYQVGVAIGAVTIHWVPRLRGRLDLAHDREFVRSAGLHGLVGLCLGLGLGWLVQQLETGWEEPPATALVWCAALPVVLLAAVDRRLLRARVAVAPPAPSAIGRRAFRTAHRGRAPRNRSHTFPSRPGTTRERRRATVTERHGLAQLETLTLPDTWWELPLAPDGEAWAAAMAAAMHDDPGARRALTRDLQRHQEELCRPPHAHLAVGVWQPDASPGSVAGFVTIDWLVPDVEHPVTPRNYRDLMAPTREDPPRLDRVVDDVDLAAGPALRVREVVAVRATRLAWRRSLRRIVTYAVFPSGCTDAIELRFVTSDLALSDDLEADAASSAASLRVLLDDATAGAATGTTGDA